MSDSVRKEKLAAAKKKLKQFKTKGRASPSPAPTSRSRTSETISINGSTSEQVTNNNGVKPNNDETPHNHIASQNNANSPAKTFPTSPKRGAAASNGGSTTHAVDNSPPQTRNSSGTGAAKTTAASVPPASSQTAHSRMSESTERLHQLSRQINGLLSETQSYIEDEESPTNQNLQYFEERNRELAALLQKHSQANEQLSAHAQLLREANEKLQSSLEHERKTFDERLRRELSALKEQLQVHIQTIGILVAEKTELQSSVAQNQKLSEQRLEELEELSGRLKASRQRISDLEKSFTKANSASQRAEQSLKDVTKDVDRLKLDLYKQNKSNEELQQQNSELQGKLQKKNGECLRLEGELVETRSKLEMSDLHVQQLQNSAHPAAPPPQPQPDPEADRQLQQLREERAQLEARITQYAGVVESMKAEQDQTTQQYQEYIDQLTAQTQHLLAQLNSLLEERDQQAHTQRQLEADLQQLAHKHESAARDETGETAAREQLAAELSQLRAELEQKQQLYQASVNDNQQLSNLVAEREGRVQELELSLQRLSEDQVDRESLLSSMQSDKTALSRAIAQNRELKMQLAELQNGYVKMSNENMDLMTGLQSEQHTSKELAARLGQQEEELKELRQQLEQSTRRLHTLEETHGSSGGGEEGEEGGLAWQLRTYQQNIPLVESLQRELSSAQDTINALTNQNSALRSQALQGHDTSGHDLQSSVLQLQGERNQMLEQLRAEQHERKGVQEKLSALQHELATAVPATLNGDVINKAQFEALQHAMQQLEEKYTHCMRARAELSDQVEQLEHIIMQLEGETETIGEYVQLYQMQRAVLRRKGAEKDEYISRLACDREHMQDKLAQLQALVMQLLADRNQLHAYPKAGSGVSHQLTTHVVRVAGSGDDSVLGRQAGASFTESQLTASTPTANRYRQPQGPEAEDWPDYSSDDSDQSEVEPIVAGSEHMTSSRDSASPAHSHSDDVTHSPATHLLGREPGRSVAHTQRTVTSHEHKAHIQGSSLYSVAGAGGADDSTAQRIMHLLTELGSSNVLERTSFLEQQGFVHCAHCTGRLLNL